MISQSVAFDTASDNLKVDLQVYWAAVSLGLVLSNTCVATASVPSINQSMEFLQRPLQNMDGGA